MSNFRIFVFLAFIACALADFNNVQTSTFDGVRGSCGGSIDAHPFVKIGTKYYYIPANVVGNWYQAAHICRSLGADLATLASEAEWQALSNHLLSKNLLNSQFWISYNDLGKEGSFHSIANGKPMVYSKWSPGQPDNAKMDEDCVCLWMHAGKYMMNDTRCNVTHHYICELSPKTITLITW